MNDYSYRRYIIAGIACTIVLVYIVRLFALQVMSDDFRKSADSNAFQKKTEYTSASCSSITSPPTTSWW